MLCKYCWQNYLHKDIDDENDDNNSCENCKQEKNIWENIVKNAYWVKIIYIDWSNFLYNEEILNENNFKKEIKKESKNSIFIIFNKWEYLFAEKNNIITKSINLYVPKDISKSKELTTKDFETIIKDDKRDGKWLDYICMLKWDIDAMSIIFKHWFDYWNIKETERNSFYSVNRLSQFSRFLELFFGTYLNKKIEERFENIYTVFSGWDDFVFIIPFSKREEFIKFLYDEFYKFVWNNSRIHFSIWLWIFKEKTPFKTMDLETENLLKKAKIKSKEKNIKNLEDIDNLLTYKWLTVYEEGFTKVFNDENISFTKEINNWKTNDNKLVIWETQIYKIYSELRRFRDILKEENIDYSEAVLIWARILNMLSRNSNDIKYKKEFEILKENIVKLIKCFNNWENKIKVEKINNILLWLVDNIYETRYLNK